MFVFVQLLSLQLQMQSTLEDYYRHRGVHNEKCYTVCQARSGDNGKRLESVEIRFSLALEEIRLFLVGHRADGSSQIEKARSSSPNQDSVDLMATGKTLSSESRKRTACSSTPMSAPVAISVVSNCA